jgi:hypothetical protein
MIANDPRAKEFAFAFAVGRRWYPWLLEEFPEDFRQQVSLALCDTLDHKQLVRAVQKRLYQLARANGYRRPSGGMARGSSGRWTRAEGGISNRSCKQVPGFVLNQKERIYAVRESY